jgi:very-short-patch-repair endonuclease
MHSQGIRVLRFTGKQVERETDWALAQIDQALGSSSSSPSSPAPWYVEGE